MQEWVGVPCPPLETMVLWRACPFIFSAPSKDPDEKFLVGRPPMA